MQRFPEGSVTEGTRSLEVRWIFPGQPETAVAGWFGRFPAETESREDTYLLSPDLPGLSVKVRAGEAFEVKVYRGSPGVLDVAGRYRGHIQFPDDLLRILEGTAALVFVQALPAGVELGTDNSRSYAEWLCRRPAVGLVRGARGT